MAIAFDAASVVNSGATVVASATVSHTSSGSDRLLLVGVSWTGSGTTMSVTHAGNAATGSLTQSDATSTYHTKIFWFTAPTTGVQNIVYTPSTTASFYGGAASFTGVDQTTPCPDNNAAIGSSFGARTLTITTTVANSWLFSAFGMANATSTITPTETVVANEGNTTTARRGGASRTNTSVATGSNSMTWTISGSTNRSWAHQIVSIMEAGGGTPPAATTCSTLSMMGVG